MKSAGYITQTCLRCKGHKYALGYDTKVFPASSWYYGWARDGLSKSGPYVERNGGCMGCAKVCMIHAQVLAVLLWKLGIEVKV